MIDIMKQLPLILSAAIFVASASAQQKTTAPNTPTPSDHLAFVLDYMRAETGNTEAMLQLSYDYETGTRLLPRDLNRALYYALRAKRHGASIEKRELDTLLTKTIDAAYQQAYPHWIRTSPDGMWQILMQRDETAAPGILFVTISQKVEQTELEDAYWPILYFPLNIVQQTSVPGIEFHDDSLTLSTLKFKLNIPCKQPASSEPEDAYELDLAARADNGDTIAMRKLSDLSGENRDEQLKWLQKASRLGDAQAMYDIGCLYDTQNADDADILKAKQAYAQAAQAGSTAAAERLSEMEQPDNPGEKEPLPVPLNIHAGSPEATDARWRELAGNGIRGFAGLGIVKFRHGNKTYYGIGELPSGPEPTIEYFLSHLYDNPEQLAADIAKWNMDFNIRLYGENMNEWAEQPKNVHLSPWTWQEKRFFSISGLATDDIQQIIREQWTSISPLHPDFLTILRATAARDNKTLADICNIYWIEGSTYDLSSARILAEHGDPHAMYALGKLYLSGEADNGFPLFMPGIAWLEKAAKMNHPGACAALGLLHAEGLGVKKDIAAARRYLQRAHGIPAAERLLQTLPPAPDK